MGGHRQSGQYAGRLNFRPSPSSPTILNPEIEEVTGGKAAEFSVLHHRPASRRLSRLLRPSRPQDAAYRFDRRARHALHALLRGDAGLHAQPRDLDDRADAVGARRAQQRLAAAAATPTPSSMRCARPATPPRWWARAICRIFPSFRRSSSGRRRARATRCSTRASPRRGSPRRPDGPYDQEHPKRWEPGRDFDMTAAVLRLRARRSVHGPRRPGRRPLLRLAQVATARRRRAARPQEPAAARLRLPAGLSHADPGGALSDRLHRRQKLRMARPLRRGRPQPAVLPDGVVPGSAPSVHAARPLLVDVPAAGHGAAARASITATGRWRARSPGRWRSARAARPSSPSRPPSRSTSARRARRWR